MHPRKIRMIRPISAILAILASVLFQMELVLSQGSQVAIFSDPCVICDACDHMEIRLKMLQDFAWEKECLLTYCRDIAEQQRQVESLNFYFADLKFLLEIVTLFFDP